MEVSVCRSAEGTCASFKQGALLPAPGQLQNLRGFHGKGESPPSSEKCSPGRGARWVDIVLGKADPDKQIHSQHLYQKTFGILLVNWFALEDDFSSSSS